MSSSYINICNSEFKPLRNLKIKKIHLCMRVFVDVCMYKCVDLSHSGKIKIAFNIIHMCSDPMNENNKSLFKKSD